MKGAGQIALAGLAGWLIAALVWSLGSNPWEMKEERTAIANMPQTQRDQMQRRFEHFQQLPEDERQKILAIHRSISADPTREALLESYSEYVSHLDPWRRESLENVREPAQRITALQELVRTPERRRPDVRRPDWMSGETVRGTTFPGEAYQQILEKLLAELATPAVAKGEKGSIEWQLWAVGRLADRWRRDRFQSWPGDVETRAYLEQLPDERFRRFVLSSDRFDEERRRSIFAAVIVRTLMARWQRVWPERVAPGEIESVLPSIDERDRRQFPWQDSSRMQSLIVDELSKRTDAVGDYAKGYQQVQQLFREFDEFGASQMRGGPNRSPRGGAIDGGGPRREGRRWSAFPQGPPRGVTPPADGSPSPTPGTPAAP